jgi:uncharacterized protein YycO
MNQRILRKNVLWSLSISILLISAMPSGLFPTTSDQVPASVQKGDIVFMDIQPGKGSKKTSYLMGTSNDHCALYLGHDYLDGNQFVEASHSGVGTISYSTLKEWYENFTFYEVATASEAQKAAAVQWAMASPPFDDDYQYWYTGARKCNDPYGWPLTSRLWYCSELVWAAYYNQGFDIDYNNWTIDFLGAPAVIIGLPFSYTTNQITADPVVQFICSD